MTQIMYVCDICAENCPENCGHYDRGDLRVLPSGDTICSDCYEDLDTSDFEIKDGEKTAWNDLPNPPEFRPTEALEDRGGCSAIGEG